MHTCKICNREFSTGQKLGGHIAIHNDRKIFCEFCSSDVLARSYKAHRVACEKLHDRSGQCECCKKPIQKDRRFCSSHCVAINRNAENNVQPDSVKTKISASLSGRVLNPLRYAPRNCKNCNLPYSPKKPTIEAKYCSIECGKAGQKKNLSASLKGRSGGPREGGGRGKGGHYNGVWLDSTWEIKYAKHLDSKGIAWHRPTERFPYVFDGQQKNYIPDFWLPEIESYVEIKGYTTPRDEAKWAQFPKKLLVLKKQELVQMGVL